MRTLVQKTLAIRRMSHPFSIGDLSEEELRVITEMRQRKAIEKPSRIPFPQYSMPAEADIVRIVQQYDDAVIKLRPGQYNCVRDLLQQQDTIAIIPTGGGKSLIWLLLAILGIRNDTTGHLPQPLVIVFVPFKATIESHCAKYSAWGPYASSNESFDVVRSKIATCNWLYCTPEKFARNQNFKDMIAGQAHRIRCNCPPLTSLLLFRCKHYRSQVHCV